VHVRGEVQQFFVEPVLGVFTFSPEADMAVRLVVSTASGLFAERRFYFKASQTAIAGTEDMFQSASDAVTRDTVQGMVDAIVTLLNRYPTLGAAPQPEAVALLAGGSR
jgi:hypothetical protein